MKLWFIAKANTRNAAFVQCRIVTLFALRRLLNLARRNRQARDHLAQLLAGGDVAEANFAELLQVEQGQALGKQLAVDDALAEAGDYAEADAAGELVKCCADTAKIVRFDMLEAVSEHHPSTPLPVCLARAVRLFQISSA